MDQEQTTLLTDGRIIAVTIFIMTLLGGGFLWAVKWIFNKVLDEIKAARNERSEFTNALQLKFTALDGYVREQELTVTRHDEKFKNLHKDTEEVKKKINEHADKLSQHSSEISNLKGRHK